MDFRTVDVAALRWTKTPRGAAVSGPGGKVVVQTPLLPCSVRPMRSTYAQGWSIDLRLPPGDELGASFGAFVQAVMQSAAAWGGVSAPEAAAPLSEFMGTRSLRVTAFSDALLFDKNGELVQEPAGAKACTCLLELQGCWTSAARWGLRWRVAQVKLADAPRPGPAPQFGFLADAGVAVPPAGPTPQFGFLDD